jgi:NADH-quinone oxidoreductase subunit N
VNPALALIPEALVVLAGLGLLAGGSLRPAWRRRLPWGAAAVVLVALGLELWLGALVGPLLGQGFTQNRFALFAKATVLVALLLLLAAGEWEPELGPTGPALALFAGFGAMIVASAGDLVGLWVGLELTSLCAVAVVSLSRRDQGLRLLLVSGAAGALTALGFAFLYGVSGAFTVADIGKVLGGEPPGVPLAIAVLLMLVGLSARALLAPFHLSGVGVVTTASPLGAGLLSGLGSGTAMLVAFKVLPALAGVSLVWSPYLSFAGCLALLGGGLAALATTRSRELVAWLGVAQLGWVAAALATDVRLGQAAGLFLLGAYVVAASVAPVLLGVLGEAPALSVLAGLGTRQPWRAVGFALALLSLAGVPPLAGFFGEFAVAASLAAQGYFWLLALGLFGAAVAVAACVRVLRVVYLLPPADEGRRLPATPVALAGWMAAGAVFVLYGLLAYPISGLALEGVRALGGR